MTFKVCKSFKIVTILKETLLNRVQFTSNNHAHVYRPFLLVYHSISVALSETDFTSSLITQYISIMTCK